jgi:hypothetical protein
MLEDPAHLVIGNMPYNYVVTQVPDNSSRLVHLDGESGMIDRGLSLERRRAE